MANALKRPVSTLTHSTREVALDFLRWRKELQAKSMVGHNGGPKISDRDFK
tara:strand:- start:20219 stop:20371 length:153 start_codon:yes stop_codon:yes gene_type:complete